MRKQIKNNNRAERNQFSNFKIFKSCFGVGLVKSYPLRIMVMEFEGKMILRGSSKEMEESGTKICA